MKTTLRKEVLQKLTAMTAMQHEQQSKQIHTQVLGLSTIKYAKIIAITMAAGTEVQTRVLIEAFWRMGKQVAVPKCNPQTRQMQFYLITSFTQLETVYMQLQEPIPQKTVAVAREDIDVMIVPGVVFDKKGYRIGFGGGYYDRYLSDYTGATVALAFDVQIYPEVPSAVHDVPIDAIITATTIITCK